MSEAEIRAALADGQRPVLVELTDDLPADFPRSRLVWIDHHGELAGADRPTSIEQVFALLDFPPDSWTRDRALVAANDRGHIAVMRAMGAPREEIREIRRRDRAARGISAEEERLGERAAAAAKHEWGGRLTVVELPRDRTATVTDFLDPALGGPGFENLVIMCPNQTFFFGSGRMVDALRDALPGGWFGGEPPVRGFWGVARPIALARLVSLLEPHP